MPKEKNACKDLSFADCELAILRMAVDKAEEKMGKRVVNSEDVQKIIDIVEDFIRRKKVICYGGTAINNILPEEDRFYNKEVEIPDYDFFSMNALSDAKELADIYYKKGFIDVEAKSGQHHGTYKVFVNYMAVADITYLQKDIFTAVKNDAISVGGILYAPPNFLRMSMYLELSRPAGDISRWEKVLKRLTLLNKNYPITNLNCNDMEFQREMADKENEEKIFETVKNSLINQGVVFFGGFANTLYSQYMPKNLRQKLENIADFDVLSNDPEKTAEIIKERLDDNGVKNVKIIKQPNVGEIVPEHYEVRIGKDSILFIYRPIGCHSYNILIMNGKKVKVATIDTMLSLYLAFLYANKPYYNQFIDRILCMSKFLFDVQQKNRLSQKGLLKRFSITCYGHQESVEEMKSEKAAKYKELKQSNDKKLFEEWFLSYKPDEIHSLNNNKEIPDKEVVKKKKKRKNTKKNNLFGLYGKKTRKNKKSLY
jgi:Poly(A) polymerase catalytic subunit